MTGRRVAVSTQEKNPRSTIIRSVLVAVLALLPIMNGALAIIVAELAPYGGTVPGWVFAILNGGIALTAVLLAILTKIMALPGVNEWFREHASWLAPEGKDGPEFKTAAEGVQYLFGDLAADEHKKQFHENLKANGVTIDGAGNIHIDGSATITPDI